MSRHKGGPRGPRLELRHADPTQKDGDNKWEVLVTAQLFGPDGSPEKEGKKVLFSTNGTKDTEECDTNALGVAETTLEIETPGRHVIYAVDAESRAFRNVTIKIVEKKPKEEAPKEEKKQRIVLQCSAPQEAGDVWTVRASAQLFDLDGMLAEKGKKILFSVDGKQEGSDFETNDLGIAEATLTIDQAGRHDIHVMAFERDVFQSVSLEIPEKPKPKEEKKEKPRQPKELLVTHVTKGFKSWITLTVLDALENGVGIPGRKIRVYDTENPLPMRDLPEETNEHGVIEFEHDLGGKNDGKVTFEVIGTNIKKSLVLRRELRRL